MILSGWKDMILTDWYLIAFILWFIHRSFDTENYNGASPTSLLVFPCTLFGKRMFFIYLLEYFLPFLPHTRETMIIMT